MFQGTDGDFWSIGATSSAGARYLLSYGSLVIPERDNYKSYGFPVHNEILYYRQFPFTLTYGGYVNQTSSSAVYQGMYGYFWSIGTTSATVASGLYFLDSDVYPELNYSKSSGFSVRSVKFNSSGRATHMFYT